MAESQPVPPSDGDQDTVRPESPDPWARGRSSGAREQEEMAAFRRFQQYMRHQDEGSPAPRRQRRRRGESEDEGGADDGGDGRGGDPGPPPSWDGQSLFEDYQIKVRLWLATTKARPRARGPLMLKAMSGVAFEALKHYAKDSQWLKSDQNAEMLLAEMERPEMFGEDRQEHMLTALSRITYHMKRQKNESRREYFVRWESAMIKVKEHNVQLPQEFEGFLLINHLQLSEAETKALLNFTYGSITPKDIKNWLRKAESRLSASELGNDKRKTTNAVLYNEKMADDLTEQDDEQEDIHAIEAHLATLHDEESAEEEVLDEAEAAEILNTMLAQKRKSVSFKQSMERKKEKELSRGYGAPKASTGRFQGNLRAKFTIEEIKKKTKCKSCGQLGHWHRDAACPNNKQDKGGGAREAHHLEILEETPEAFFIGLLEPTDRDLLETADGDEIITCASTIESPMERPEHEQAILAEPFAFSSRNDGPTSIEHYVPSDRIACDVVHSYPLFDCFSLQTRSVGNHDLDSTCATLDTGCQRLAVGIRTLRKFMTTLPEPLRITLHQETNRFKSIHGISTTEQIASVPVSLGSKGCFLRPAVFRDGHSQDAPFLISLSFLTHCRAKLQLDQERGMTLSLRGMSEPLECHVGPTGALRIPLQKFTKNMLEHLVEALRRHENGPKNEFEVLTAMHEPHDDAATTSSSRYPPSNSDQPESYAGGSRNEQAPAPDRGQLSESQQLAAPAPEDVLHVGPALGNSPAREDRKRPGPDRGPHGQDEREGARGGQADGRGGDLPEGARRGGRQVQHGLKSSSTTDRDRGEEDRGVPAGRGRAEPGARLGDPVRSQADVLLRAGLQAGDVAQGGQELRAVHEQ